MHRCIEIGCDRAGSHGDPRYPMAAVCWVHRQPSDVLLIGDVPVRPQGPRKAPPPLLADDDVA
jgi:hypothetical protein